MVPTGRIFMGYLTLILTITIFILVIDSILGENEIFVDDDVTNGGDGSREMPYNTIQEAVNNASNGNTIRVWAGEYSEKVVVETSVNIIGNGSGETILKGDRKGIAMRFKEISGCSVVNLTIDNYSVGIELEESDYMTISNTSFLLCGTSAIYLGESDFSIINNSTFENCGSEGILIKGNYNSIQGNSFNDMDTGIIFNSCGSNTISENSIENCRYGIYMYQSTNGNSLTFNRILDNKYGIYVRSTTDHNSFIGNEIFGNEFGLFIENTSPYNVMHYNNIYNNTKFGFNVSSDSEMNATHNWWGNSTGPHHPTENTNGTGDTITDNILFTPWLEETMDWTLKAHIESLAPNPAPLGESIRFHGSGTGKEDIVRYVWRSSIDGEFYNDTQSIFEYSGLSLGEHTIQFKVQDEIGDWSNEATWIIAITIKPVATILSIIPNPALYREIIRLTANGTDDGTIESYAWSSDGVEMYSGKYPQFSLSGFSVGIYTIILRVRDDHGIWSEEAQETLVVHDQPTAAIESISPNPAMDEDTIHFSGRGTDDGSIERYAWRIEGNELHNDTTAEFSYSDLGPGNYSVFLKVMDNYGMWSDEVHQTLIIHGRPIAMIGTISPNPALVTDTISFSGNGTDDGVIEWYVWRIDETELSNGTHPSLLHAGLSPGTHDVFLKVLDNHGIWSEEVTRVLFVHEKPMASIDSISPNPGLDSDTILFSGTGVDDGAIECYAWRVNETEVYNYTDASFSLGDLVPGTHSVFLKVLDNHGVWSDEVSRDLLILADSDDDRIADPDDAFPNDASASFDTDGDGHPDAWNEGKTEIDSTTGLKLDRFPENPEKWKEEEDDGGGLLPGFEFVIIIASIIGSIIIRRK